MEIKILGTGCSKCQKLAEATNAAAQALNLDYQLDRKSVV